MADGDESEAPVPRERFEIKQSAGKERNSCINFPCQARQIRETLALFDAVKNKDKAGVRDLHKAGCNMEATDKDGSTALILAASLGLAEVVRQLCELSVNVNARDKKERTALHHSSMRGFHEVVQVLTEYRADINCQDYEKMTPLHLAVYHGDITVVKVLLCAGASLTLKDKNGRSPEKLAKETPNSSQILNLLQEQKRVRKDQTRSDRSMLQKFFSRPKRMSSAVNHQYENLLPAA